MKPVNQTRFAAPGENEPTVELPGNCWQACVASILELPLAEVPDLRDFWLPGMTLGEVWRPYEKKMHRWLNERGIVLLCLAWGNLFYGGPEGCLNMHCIASGPSPRNPDISHAVVLCGNDFVHDPHPSRAYLAGEPAQWWVELFVRR